MNNIFYKCFKCYNKFKIHELIYGGIKNGYYR